MAMTEINLSKRRQENHLHPILVGRGVEVETEDQAGDQAVEAETEDQAVGQTTTIHINWEMIMRTINIGNRQKQRNCLDSLI